MRPITEARRTLDLVADEILRVTRLKTNATSAQGRGLLEGIHRLVRAVQGNLYLDRARADCLRDYRREQASLARRRTKLLRELVAVRKEAEKQFPTVAQSATVPATSDDSDSLADFDSVMRSLLGGSGEVDEGDPGDENAGSARPVDILWTLLSEFLPDHGVAPTDPVLSTLKKKVESVRGGIRRVRHAHAVLERVHPAARWAWVQKVVDDCDLDAISSPEWSLTKALLALPPYKHYWNLLHGRALGTDDTLWLETFRPDAATNVQAIRAEFHRLLGNRASAAWLLHRYAQRTRLLRRKELQAILKRSSI